MPTTSREDYLKRIFMLEQEHPDEAVAMGELAQAVEVAAGSATGMVKTLVDMGLVDYEPYVGVRLTEQGRKIAIHVLRRHRLIEAFLVQTLEVDWSEVDREAEAIEHVISEQLLEKIDLYLGHPTVDPHGDPIPDARGRFARLRTRNLAHCQLGQRVRIARVMDQDPQFLQFIERIGLKPGVQMSVQSIDPQAQVLVVATAQQEAINLSLHAAGKLMVDVL